MARKHTTTLMTEKDGIRGLVPARNRGYRDRVFAEYFDTLNPRANVVMQKALAASPDVRFQEFLDRVMTPKYLRTSLATIAKGCGIDLLEFNQWWGKALAQRAIAETQLASPDVVEDLIEDEIQERRMRPLRGYRHPSRPAGCRRRYPRLSSGAGGFRRARRRLHPHVSQMRR
jgi:hypothetical protein